MLNCNCPKIPSPKKIKEGIANFLKIYPKYTNYYNNLYNSKSLSGYSNECYWPKCHTITAYSNCGDAITDSICSELSKWIEGTSLKIEVVGDKSKADLKIYIGEENTIPGAGGYTSSYGILNLRDGFNFFIDGKQDEFTEFYIRNRKFDESIFLHEFGHFLGFLHEHSRSDRPWTFDIKKLKKDIENPKIARTLPLAGDYKRIEDAILSTANIKPRSPAYDFKSIMQYNLSDMRNYIICDNGVNCEGLFEYNAVLSDTDKSWCKKIYGSGKNCPEPPPLPPFKPKKCAQLEGELELAEDILYYQIQTIWEKKGKLVEYENKWREGNYDEKKHYRELVRQQNKNIFKLEKEKFDNQYLIKELKSIIEERCPATTTTTPNPEKTRNDNCEFLLNLEKAIEAMLSHANSMKKKMKSILEADKQKLKLLNYFRNIYGKGAIYTYNEIDSAIKKLHELTSYKLKKQQQILTKEVKNKAKGFSQIEKTIEDVFFDLQIAQENESIKKINNTLELLISKFESSIKELTSLIPIISFLKIEFCPTTTPRPITTPQSTSTPRPVFISKS